MKKKHFLPLGFVLATGLLLVAIALYPGGNNHDAYTPGFDWRYNYISNLFPALAINGAANVSRFWAISGVCCWCFCMGYFFFEFSTRIPQKGAAAVVRYSGIAGAAFAALAATPLHDQALMVASTATLLGTFYILVFVFRAKMVALGVFSVFTMLVAYFTNYVYFTQQLMFVLPLLQKFGLLVQVAWMLTLYYKAPAERFLERQVA